MEGMGEGSSASRKRREEIDGLLSGTFNSILRIEKQSLDNRLTHGLTITEVHTIVAIGLHERNPMNVVAARLGVTLATLTTAVGKLADKGLIKEIRHEDGAFSGKSKAYAADLKRVSEAAGIDIDAFLPTADEAHGEERSPCDMPDGEAPSPSTGEGASRDWVKKLHPIPKGKDYWR